MVAKRAMQGDTFDLGELMGLAPSVFHCNKAALGGRLSVSAVPVSLWHLSSSADFACCKCIFFMVVMHCFKGKKKKKKRGKGWSVSSAALCEQKAKFSTCLSHFSALSFFLLVVNTPFAVFS